MSADPDSPRRPAPIGVFDSGVGGLTVLRSLRALMPHEDFIYLGDTARLPYGTKSAQSVVRYSLQCADALIGRGIRCLVVACNTASASSLPALRERHPTLPVVGVIEPGAKAAAMASTRKRIAVIGTEGTIAGGAYQRAIEAWAPEAQVLAVACSLFVALAEEGWTTGAIPEAIARQYLSPLFSAREAPDTLVLGCTHFPALLEPIRSVLPAAVNIVDSADTTALAVQAQLQERVRTEGIGRLTLLATDGAARFARVGSRFLGEPIRAEAIDIVDLSQVSA